MKKETLRSCCGGLFLSRLGQKLLAPRIAARPASQEEQLNGMLRGMLLCCTDDVPEQMRDCAGREKFSLEANPAK